MFSSIVVVALAASLEGDSDLNLITGYYTVPIDHFNRSDSRTLRLVSNIKLSFYKNKQNNLCASLLPQSYRANLKYYKENGPIFVNIHNNKGDLYLKSGLIHDLARAIDGAIVTTDDRFTDGSPLP